MTIKDHTTRPVRVHLLNEQIETIDTLAKQSGIGFSSALIRFLTEHLPTQVTVQNGIHEQSSNTFSH